MAILQVIEYQRETDIGLEIVHKFLIPRFSTSRMFQVVTDSPTTSHLSIQFDSRIPQLYSLHPEYGGSICKKISIKQHDDEESIIFDVVAEYDDKFDGADPEKPTDNNPLNRPTIISGGSNEHDEIVVIDVNGVPVQNKAKDSFDPPLTRKGGALRFSMTKNYPTLDLAYIRSYKNAINSDSWFGQAAQTVRIANITFSRQIEDMQVSDTVTVKVVYWTYTFEFEIADAGLGDGTWRKYVLNQGYRYLSGSDLIPITGKDGLPVSKPVNLDSSGGVGSPASPVWLTFDVYRQLPFAALNLV